MINRTLLIVVLFLVLVLILYTLYRKNFKRMVVGSVCLLTGKPKTGKTLCCACLSGKDFKRRHRVWWFKKKILLNRDLEEPLFYTNAAYSFGNLKRELSGKKKPHRLNRCIKKLDLGHLERNYRFNYGSVIFIDESSLLSDNQDVRNQVRNVELSLFNKLIAHETRGGALYYDTQNIQDMHYACKRCCSNFFFIQKSINFWLFRILYVREMISEDLGGQNNFNDDVDLTTRKVLIFRWWYKKYDRYYFSFLTDKLKAKNVEGKWYKGEIESFNPLYRKLSLKYRSSKKNKDIKNEILNDSTYRKRGFIEYEEKK